MATVFSRYTSAKWTVAGESIVFPITELKEIYRNRIIPHKRPYREGARLDDTHSDPIGWQITIEAYNSLDHEKDVDGLNFYPVVLNKLLDSFTEHETGELVVPTRGKRRCRAESYERVERHTEIDFAAVVLTFMEDNEDDSSAADFTAPSAAAIARATAEDADDAAEEEGAGGDLGAQINELGASIEGTMNAPGDFVGDIESKANGMASAVEKVEDTFAKTTAEASNEVETLLTNPSASRAGRLHRQISDVAKKAVTQKQLNIGREIITRTFRRDLSIYVIATTAGNTPEDVLNLNPGLDPFNVLAGTSVRLYAT